MKQQTNSNICVIGAGTMGRGIAQLAARNNHRVILYDDNVQQSKHAVKSIQATLQRIGDTARSAEKVSKILSHITIANTLQECTQADLIIEAIIEDVAVKQHLFAQLESMCAKHCIFASNTSTLSISALAAKLKHPERLVGMHFFNPAPRMKLVEIIRGLKTSQKTIQTIQSLAFSWGKKTVVCTSSPGFIVNRISRPFYVEALALKETSDLDFSVIDGLLVASGQFPMGAFQLIDLIGVDVNYRNTFSLFEAFHFDKRYKPSLLQKEYVDAGYNGKKSGRGFYDYSRATQHTLFQQLKEKHRVQIHRQSDNTYAITASDANEDAPFVNLLARFSRLGHAKKTSSFIDEQPYITIEGVTCFLCYGKTAAEISRQTKKSICVIDWSIDYQQSDCLGISVCLVKGTVTLEKFLHVLQQLLQLPLIHLPDTAALVVARTIAMLINESCDAVQQGVCTPESADIGVTHGLNYSKGLFALAEYFGWLRVRKTIEGLMRFYQTERYRLSPLLQLRSQEK